MKKSLFIATALLAVSCSVKDAELANVTFGYSDYEKGTLTRAVLPSEAIKEVIRKSMPTTFQLDLCYNKTNTHIQAEIGKELTIPVGDYTVKGQTEAVSPMSVSNCIISTTPYMNINENVAVSLDRKEYALNARFDCFAILVDFNEITRVTLDGADVEFFVDGNYGIAYIKDFQSNMKLVVYPKDGMYNEEKTFVLAKKDINGIIFCQKGYYYFVHPKVIDTQGMSFTLNYEEMIGQDVK